MKASFLGVAVALLGMFGVSVSANNTVWQEYEKLIDSREVVAVLGPTLFGDSVNLYTGALSFSATDASIPGNSSLSVSVNRTFSVGHGKGSAVHTYPFADWDLELPRISGVFSTSKGWVTSGTASQRCSLPGSPPPITFSTVDFQPHEYWAGTQLSLPGGGGGELLAASRSGGEITTSSTGRTRPGTGGPYYWLTSDWTYLSCLPSLLNDSGEGFLAVTASGTKYWFNWMATYSEPSLKKARRGGLSGNEVVSRKRYTLYATRVEDRFGNWVQYSYDNAANSPVRITSIDASDGRRISFSYNAKNHISTVTAGSQVWQYQYGAAVNRWGVATSASTLTGVILPDNSRWTVDFGALSSATLWYYDDEPGIQVRNCFDPGDVDDTPRTGTITHPSGAVGSFTVAATRFGRSNVLAMCSNVTVSNSSSQWVWHYTTPPNDPNDDTAYYPIAWDTYALTQKQITGPGLTPASWNYQYHSTISWFLHPSGGGLAACTAGDCVSPQCLSDSCAGKTTTQVWGPDNSYLRYTFGNSYRYDEGKLRKTEYGAAMPFQAPSSIARVDTLAYQFAQTGQTFPTPVGVSPQLRSGAGFSAEHLRPQRSQTIEQDGVSFSNVVNSYDRFANPTSVTRFNSLGHSRTDVTVYANDLSKWVLGQTASVTDSATGQVISQTDYDSNAQPWQVYQFGKLQHTLSYNSDGTLATVKDGNNHSTLLSSWKRGIPQRITHADSTTESAVVDDNGWIGSVTDENGFKTCYGYDAMGRLASITYPSETTVGICDTSSWAQTTQVFAPVAASEYGIAAGHWKQTFSTGNGRTVRYVDALWRPLVEERFDNANKAATLSQTVRRYDAEGQQIFQSYPINNLSHYNAVTLGTRTRYDALNRVTDVDQDSELGVLNTHTNYLAGFQTEVTNPRGHRTTTAYLVFDQPVYDWPTAIAHPAGAYTDIVRDSFGKPLSISRSDGGGAASTTRHYVYNANQLLCKTIEPETGSTVVDYDAANNLLWSAAGLALPSPSQCDSQHASIAARQITRTYDSRHRLRTLTFPDGNGNQVWTYTADGLPDTVTTRNNGVQTSNTYSYNKRRLLSAETLGQTGLSTWTLSYGYDSNANLSAHTLPGGEVISYAPNALGQATQAASAFGTYATAATYYPNGALKQFRYGSGIVHTLSQNTRGLPERSVDQYGSAAAVLDDRYSYDANGNVASISDGLSGNRGNRTMSYDGLDRLTATSSPMFGTGASYTYNALDNLTRITIGGNNARDQHYCYDSAQRLTAIKTGSCSGNTVTHLGYDVQGNLRSKNSSQYSFDYGNRLRSVSQNGTELESYRYDAHGRRHLAIAASGTVRSHYGQDGVLRYQSDGRRNQQLHYIYLNGSLVATRATPLAGGSSTIRYQHTDALGSPVAVTDHTRTVTERSEYEPYGHLLNRPISDGPGYTGHVADALSGLSYLQQRYYDPAIGRFLSVDPVTALDNGDLRHFNRYAYAFSNPYTFTDPDGRNPLTAFRGGMIIGEGLNAAAYWLTGATLTTMLVDVVWEAVHNESAEDITSSGSDKPSLLDEKGKKHVLDSDDEGGGHRAGTGKPGKSEFPSSWSDDKILGEISDVATDPQSQTSPGRDGATITEGTRDGVKIRVITDSKGRIVSGWPKSGQGVTQNPKEKE